MNEKEGLIETDKSGEDNNTNKSGQRLSRGRVCQVCGDKALGYNFNAVTCESCKAFFRRNALVKKEFTCPFNQNCEISVVTRRFCQKCRLTKCFSVGMKKEYIMSDEDKIEKRKKIEQNRAKRRVNSGSDAEGQGKRIKSEDGNEDSSWSNMEEAQGFVPIEFTECSPESFSGSSSIYQPEFTTPDMELIEQPPMQPALTPSEIVSKLTDEPEKSSQAINTLMPTQQDALKIMSIVISSPTDALRLISHFIAQPGDALTIISKIMNSALDALSVFIQFMSSPTDALQIVNKIMSSPSEVLQFLQQLMKYPQDALDIMTKFMNEPAEALKMINRMINNEEIQMPEANTEHDRLRKSVEGNLIKSIISTNTIEVAPALEPNPQASFNPFAPYVQLGYPSTSATESPAAATATSAPPQPPMAIENGVADRTRDIFEEVTKQPIQPNSIEAILCEAIKIEYGCLNSTNKMQSRELSDSEQAKLNELIVANKALYAPLDEDWANLINDNSRLKGGSNQQNPQLLTVINLTAIAIRRLIKMSKKISAFKNMCQEDQVALLKGGCVEMMILRSVMQYDCDKATWKIPHSEMSNIKADVLKLAKGNVYQEHEQFIKTFDKKLRTDENIILIMCAITLFTHDRPRTIHSDVIKLEQNSYYYLLRRYLESVFPGCEAKATFLKLIQKINELHKLNEEIVNVYLDVNPAQVEPLLREIFDLKVNMS